MSTSTNTKHKKDKSKKQKSSSYKSVAIIDADKNEGVDQSWAFQPPEGTKHISTTAGVDNGEFDWDAVEQDEDAELWVLRVPDNVRRILIFLRFSAHFVWNRSDLNILKVFLLTSHHFFRLQRKEKTGLHE